MLTITQSQSIPRLFAHLVADMRQRNASGELGVFDVYNLIVPSSSVKTWIMNELASTEGISAMINAKFWGSYQWQLMSDVLDTAPLSSTEIDSLPTILKTNYKNNYRLVPRDPSLSIGFMQWRIFGFLEQEHHAFSTFSEKKQHAHPLYDFFALGESANEVSKQHDSQHASRWWQLAKQIAQVFSAYLTHRPEWLAGWSAKKPKPLDVTVLVSQKDKLNKQNGQATTPDWLLSRYEKVALWQQYIWRALFVEDFHYRQALYKWFWKTLHEPAYKDRLPKQITFFTLPPVPKTELAFIRQLSSYTDITFLYYNPSQEYWADITDPYWLGKHSLTQPELARLRETGHFLLARMGKQARDTFQLLIELSGNVDDLFEQVAWQDDFIEPEPTNLLQQIQQDILLLQEDGAIDWQLSQENQPDSSIRINACHSLVRQLEVLREDIVVWLNTEKHRTLSDVVVMLPDLASHAATVSAIFPNHKGTDGYHLPAKLTGLVEAETDLLWQAFQQRYTLLTGRLTSEALFDWLMLPPVFESLGLSYEQMQRGCELLAQAGFKRGFDAVHLKQTLTALPENSTDAHTSFDGDSRFTLRYALDRLALGLVMPTVPVFIADSHDEVERSHVASRHSLPFSEVSLADADVVNALLLAYADLAACRHHVSQRQSVSYWLTNHLLPDLETHFHLARGQQSWQEVTNAMTQLAAAYQSFATAPAHEKEKKQHTQTYSLNFVLDALGELLASDMRGSEPTGAITFCRIGTIRPVPYKLVVVMNMNISDYPQREQQSHFNLMHAGLAQVGDRQREDDETGAFLDALMMAEDACWFFYNGFSTMDTHQHLPANPLQELMLFLESVYQKKSAMLDMGVDTENGTINETSDSEKVTSIPQFIAHAALPFSTDSFQPALSKSTTKMINQSAQRRQGFWYDLHNVLYDNMKNATSAQPFSTWSDDVLFPSLIALTSDSPQSEFIDGKRFINDLAKPAQHFLRSQYIATVESADTLATSEPLILDSLNEYHIRDALLDDMASNTNELTQKLTFDNLLPAGVVQDAYLKKAKSFLQAQLDELKKYASEGKTPTYDQTVTIGRQDQPIHITYPLPEANVTLWANVLPTNGKDHHKLKLWLTHLLWQVARRTTDKQVAEQDGKTLCIYAKNLTVSFAPVSKKNALSYLNDWLAVWKRNQHVPMVLPAKYALLAANKLNQNKDELLTKSEMNQWLNGNNQFDYTPDDCALHPAWQLILAGEKPLDRLMQSIDVFVERLYVPLRKYEKKC